MTERSRMRRSCLLFLSVLWLAAASPGRVILQVPFGKIETLRLDSTHTLSTSVYRRA